MRLYAFLLIAAVALHARAATIPAPETEKKLVTNFPEDLHKNSENISSEQELLEQANTIKDIENKLRVKSENIPVEVIVQDVQPSLKTEDVLVEINRPVPDLRNPGPPQRQEHETQNPEYYSSEQQHSVSNFEQSINEVQNVFRQRFQEITDGIQNMIGSNQHIETIQQTVLSLREGFTDQINKINGTIQKYFTENPNFNPTAANPAILRFHEIEKSLETIKADFNRGVKNLAYGIEKATLVKGDTTSTSENPSSSTPTTPAESNPLQNIYQQFQSTISAWQQSMTNIMQNQINIFPSSNTPKPTEEQSQVTTAPTSQTQAQNQPSEQSGWPFISFIQNFFNRPESSTESSTATTQSTPVKPSESTEENKPDVHEPEKPAKPETAQAADTTLGPIRQILQNNPISQSITSAVQKLQQNIVNPDKPKEVETVDEQKNVVVTKQDEEKSENESVKGGFFPPPPPFGGHHSGDNIDIDISRIEENLTVNDEEKIPEVEKPNEDELAAHKTPVDVNKTE